MAYVINAGAHVLITFRGTLFNQLVMNTFHYRLTGTVIADGAAALNTLLTASIALDNMYNAWLNAIGDEVLNCVREGQWIDPFRYRKQTFAPAAQQGTAGTTSTPNTACVLTLASDEATRHGIGNKHLPGLPDSAMVGGTLGATQLGLMDALGTLAKATITQGANTFVPVIYNRANPPASFDVKQQFSNPFVRVQRRRTVGLGK